MHIKTKLFDFDYHRWILEADTVAAFIAEMRAIVIITAETSDEATLRLSIRTSSYYPELVDQWIVIPKDSAELFVTMIPFQVMTQGKPDGSIKVTHARPHGGLLGWCELLEKAPS